MTPTPPPYIGAPPYFSTLIAPTEAAVVPDPVTPAAQGWFLVVLITVVVVWAWR
jgi:hypothetical protein